MSDYNLRLDIPARAFINAKLISLVQDGASLSNAKQHLLPEIGLPKEEIYGYRLDDPAMVISLLYCMIVVPRELLSLPENHQIYREFDEKRIAAHSPAIDPPVDSYNLIWCLRNSLAHALFSISVKHGQASYEFHTERKPILKSAEIGHAALLNLINVVGKSFTNTLLARKSNA